MSAGVSIARTMRDSTPVIAVVTKPVNTGPGAYVYVPQVNVEHPQYGLPYVDVGTTNVQYILTQVINSPGSETGVATAKIMYAGFGASTIYLPRLTAERYPALQDWQKWCYFTAVVYNGSPVSVVVNTEMIDGITGEKYNVRAPIYADTWGLIGVAVRIAPPGVSAVHTVNVTFSDPAHVMADGVTFYSTQFIADGSSTNDCSVPYLDAPRIFPTENFYGTYGPCALHGTAFPVGTCSAGTDAVNIWLPDWVPGYIPLSSDTRSGNVHSCDACGCGGTCASDCTSNVYQPCCVDNIIGPPKVYPWLCYDAANPSSDYLFASRCTVASAPGSACCSNGCTATTAPNGGAGCASTTPNPYCWTPCCGPVDPSWWESQRTCVPSALWGQSYVSLSNGGVFGGYASGPPNVLARRLAGWLLHAQSESPWYYGDGNTHTSYSRLVNYDAEPVVVKNYGNISGIPGSQKIPTRSSGVIVMQ